MQRTDLRVVLGSASIALLLVATVGVVGIIARGPAQTPLEGLRPLRVAPATPPPAVPAAATDPAAIDPAAAPARSRPRMTDMEIARLLSSLQGEALIAMLWQIDQTAAVPVSFGLLQRNAARFAGRAVVIEGAALEVHDTDDGSFIRLGTGDDGVNTYAVMTYLPPGDEIVAGRRVRVYGTYAETLTYDTVLGATLTIPRINAVAVVRTTVPRRPARQRL